MGQWFGVDPCASNGMDRAEDALDLLPQGAERQYDIDGSIAHFSESPELSCLKVLHSLNTCTLASKLYSKVL